MSAALRRLLREQKHALPEHAPAPLVVVDESGGVAQQVGGTVEQLDSGVSTAVRKGPLMAPPTAWGQ
jgi:hypothetical protein